RTILMEGSVEVPALEDVLRFEAMDDENDGATAQQSAESSPVAPSAIAASPADGPDVSGLTDGPTPEEARNLFGSARRAATFSWRRPSDARDGGTPATPRAMALASATPAPPEATPMEIAAAPVIVAPGPGA